MSGRSVTNANCNRNASKQIEATCPLTINQILDSNQCSTKLELRQQSVIASEFQLAQLFCSFALSFNVPLELGMKFRFPGNKRNAVAARPAISEQRTLTFMGLPVEIHQCIVTEVCG